jgi:hypothetical protein
MPPADARRASTRPPCAPHVAVAEHGVLFCRWFTNLARAGGSAVLGCNSGGGVGDDRVREVVRGATEGVDVVDLLLQGTSANQRDVGARAQGAA